MDKLVIVESPAKSRTIKKFLGRDYMVKATFGHIRDLPAKKLAVDIENDFQPTYAVLPSKRKVVNELKKSSKEMKEIYIATDEDREGEAIGWHTAAILKKGIDEVKRVVFHEITSDAVKAAFNSPRKIDLNLVNAQQARRILDRLVGYKISPLLGKNIRWGLSAGRVQSAALWLITEREKEIEKFKPTAYWRIRVNLGKGEESFVAGLVGKGKKKFEKREIKNEESAKKIVEELRRAKFFVSLVEEKEQKIYPFPPFTTSTLQQEGSWRLRFSSKKTMQIAQQLYEGIDLGKGGRAGLITYMRTDSVFVAKQAKFSTRKFIKEEIGDEFLPSFPPSYKTKSLLAQEAHEAIRPTSTFRTPEKVKEFLTSDQYTLYRLIWQRFLASQMKPVISEITNVEIKGGEYFLSSQGKRLKFEGFRKVYLERKNEKEVILPALLKGDELSLLKVDSEKEFTKPSPRYSEATLIKTMEKYGIGRPSTYAPTISTILNRGYVNLKKRIFYPTSLGITVSKVMSQFFPEVINLQFTANLEEDLDKIAQGKKKWQEVLAVFYSSFSRTLKAASLQMKREKKEEVFSSELCPECGGKLVLRESRYGKFWGCKNFPKCRFTKKFTTLKSSINASRKT